MVKKVPAFAFDIDGVLVRGAVPLEGAPETIQTLQQAGHTPFIFLTNGGGLHEDAHTARLASRLNIPLDHRQFVQSHSPFHDLVSQYADKPILVLGGSGDQIRDVAKIYGFNKVITSADIFVEDSSLHPFPELTQDALRAKGRVWNEIESIDVPIKQTPIAAIMVWSSPRDWCLDLQLVLDLLLSEGGLVNTKSPKNGNSAFENNGYLQDNQPPLYFCNPDFEWATQASQPRLAQGAFKAALEGMWNEKTGGAELKAIVCGKPTEVTYNYGEQALERWSNRERDDETDTEKQFEIGTVYMIGDNPASDIQGANGFVSKRGYTWKSILVETGVYQKGTQPEHEPMHIAANVQDAVSWALVDFCQGAE